MCCLVLAFSWLEARTSRFGRPLDVQSFGEFMLFFSSLLSLCLRASVNGGKRLTVTCDAIDGIGIGCDSAGGGVVAEGGTGGTCTSYIAVAAGWEG